MDAHPLHLHLAPSQGVAACCLAGKMPPCTTPCPGHQTAYIQASAWLRTPLCNPGALCNACIASIPVAPIPEEACPDSYFPETCACATGWGTFCACFFGAILSHPSGASSMPTPSLSPLPSATTWLLPLVRSPHMGRSLPSCVALCWYKRCFQPPTGSFFSDQILSIFLVSSVISSSPTPSNCWVWS